MERRIANREGERLDGCWTAGRPGDRRLVVVGHGLTSQHDRPWLVALSEALARLGIASLRFSFAGNGASEGRFEAATISKEVADLGSVLDALADRVVAYAGHSMGAAVGVLRAARDPRLRALVSLAGMVHVREFMVAQFGHLTPGRDVMLDKPQCPLTREFLDDAAAVGSVLAAGATLTVPWLIVHGDADEIVPYRDAVDMHRAAPHATLRTLPGVDHRFSGQQRAVAELVAAWLDRATAGVSGPG